MLFLNSILYAISVVKSDLQAEKFFNIFSQKKSCYLLDADGHLHHGAGEEQHAVPLLDEGHLALPNKKENIIQKQYAVSRRCF